MSSKSTRQSRGASRSVSKPRTGGHSSGGQLSRVSKPTLRRGQTSEGNIERRSK